MIENAEANADAARHVAPLSPGLDPPVPELDVEVEVEPDEPLTDVELAVDPPTPEVEVEPTLDELPTDVELTWDEELEAPAPLAAVELLPHPPIAAPVIAATHTAPVPSFHRFM